MLVSVFAAWMFSVVTNDLADVETDNISNQNRPLQKGIFDPKTYRDYGLVFLLLALLLAVSVSKTSFVLVALYLLVTWVYSQYPFRLKKFLFVSSAVSAIATIVLVPQVIPNDGFSPKN